MDGIGEWTEVHQIREWGFSRALRMVFAFPLAVIPSENLTNYSRLHSRIPSAWAKSTTPSGGLREDGIADLLDQVQYLGFPTVGETFDGLLNNIFKSAVEEEHVLAAIKSAEIQEAVLEGNHGGGTAMRSHGFKAGTGTSSRVLKGDGDIEYTVGVIVQNNCQKDGHVGAEGYREWQGCRGKRIAQRAGMGLSQVSGHGVGRNFSGEFFMALSTANTPESPSSWD
ncbi:hypothetical protein J3459_017830 [Metarhizium acridum]|uniref:uncharacterized protein n=1 Tax=Metarhizium acridum TaxID=92637 RepID=UPI001C6C5D9C|nr:hypothetical protein J3459_017830 [Metarhizium acridum]KAG8410407.1 hypothetical protein J3458_017731 [Metarhizium acridum]